MKPGYGDMNYMQNFDRNIYGKLPLVTPRRRWDKRLR
jgi:hypothetical protein